MPAPSITHRIGLGRNLTAAEVDANFDAITSAVSNVDNTSDATKPVSTAQAAAIAALVQNNLNPSTSVAPSASAVNAGLAALVQNSMAASTTLAPSVTAVQTAINTAVTGLLDFKGTIDASTSPNYNAALKGDTYVISIAGKVGGASGKSVDAGDYLIAAFDNAGGTEAAVGVNWSVIEHNLVGALVAANALSELTGVAATARANIGAAPASGIALSALATEATATAVANLSGSTASPSAVTMTALAAALLATGAFSNLVSSASAVNLLAAGNTTALFPSSDGAASWSPYGTTAVGTPGGTATAGTFNTTSVQTREASIAYTSAATAAVAVGANMGGGGSKMYIPSASISGPDLKVEIKAMVADVVTLTRTFIGISLGSSANINLGNPSSRNNMIGLWQDDNDSFYQLGVTTSAGTPTKVTTAIPVNTLNHKLWVRIRVKGFPTNTYTIELWDNDVFVQSNTFTYAQAGLVQEVQAFAYRANTTANIVAINCYGFASGGFATIGDATSLAVTAPLSAAAGRTLLSSDNATTILYTGSAAADFTVPTGLGFPLELEICKTGTGNPRFVAASGVTINGINTGTAGPVTVPYSSIVLQALSADNYRVIA